MLSLLIHTSEMASKTFALKLKLFSLSFLSLPLSLLVLITVFQLKTQWIAVDHLDDEALEDVSDWSINSTSDLQRNRSQLLDLLEKEFEGNDIKIGLVNINEGEEEWKKLGETSLIYFDQVLQEDQQWKAFFPVWINEERWPLPKCPRVPMPVFEEYDKFDVVVSKLHCGNEVEGEGVRDVLRLQINLVVANIVVRSGRRDDGDQPVYVVFIGSCEPMWEIFRCDDLFIHEGDFWIYRPDMRRLRQKVLMPVGTCQLALPYVKQDDGKIIYKLAKLGNPIDNPREAYVTILHSSEDYVCGAIALAQSIIYTNSTKDLVLLADESITAKSIRALQIAGWKIKPIERIRSPQAEPEAYNEWNYSKLRLWQLTEYDKIIFIDSDLIVLKNFDDFFLLPQLSAVGNDKVLFNSGVMVIEPSNCMFEMLMKKRHTLVSYNGGDQGFLNEAFTWWHRWPKNMNYLKMFEVNETERELPESLYAIHYLGLKPWMCYRDYDCNWDSLDHQAFASDSAHRRWWEVYDAMPKRLQAFCRLSKNMSARVKEKRAWAKNARLIDNHWKIKKLSPPFDFIANELVGKEINIGLVNIGEEDEEAWGELGKKNLVHFERVSQNLLWKDIFPVWIDEEEKRRKPECPEIPMPIFEKYDKLDVVVARVPCGSGGEKEGIRDMFRLQVNLVVANLVVRNGRKDFDRPVYVVFIGLCGPMWEIFRCDDLLRHEGEYWIYKPDLRRLEQKVLMPVGSCQLVVPYMKHGKGKGDFDFSKFKNPIDHPREAYVTVLHSSEDYVCGAIALAQSIIRTNSTKELVLLADQSIGEKARQALEIAGWKIENIKRIESPFARKNAYNKWNYSKLRIWQLTAYDKVIFIDSDLIILKNIDNFFMNPQLSAVANSRVIFNSGIMAIEPSKCVFKTLMKKRHTLFSSNGGDQGFLNEAFTWWHRWPKKLNYLKMFAQLNVSHNELPESLYAIHYLGIKPWMCYRDYDCNWDSAGHRQFASDSAHKWWWQVHDNMPERLHEICALSERMDLRIKKWRAMAENASLPDGHWKIEIKDPRQH
ncbi:hypothetical protein HHK36_012620 [Tetracentron sinense]|uniref:Hexosyltransferase n=1 Tax=Tetracentron sinense TaxID=13715 RepID=A0A835DIU4_TETSI|nr:hypothetical protein HHK36_012620 [Tetracentron sinense]